MAKNKFGIPDVLSEIRARDKACVYCRKTLIYPYQTKSSADCETIEHLNCDGPFYWSDGLQAHDIAFCCGSCNSSRGAKKLDAWFETQHCIDRNISVNSVAAPVTAYLQRQKEQN